MRDDRGSIEEANWDVLTHVGRDLRHHDLGVGGAVCVTEAVRNIDQGLCDLATIAAVSEDGIDTLGDGWNASGFG